MYWTPDLLSLRPSPVLNVSPHMREMTIILLILFLATNIVAQDWYVQIANQSKLIGKITQNEDWNSIFNYAKKELELPSESLSDILKTIEFQTSHKDSNLIDQFFHHICDSTYREFPYRRSGNLTDDLYIKPTIDTSEIWQILNKINGLNLYPKFAEIINIKEETLLPKLIEYLKNDAATRLCVEPMEWDEAPFYLSISDVAMELLEVKTYCDFFDNASHSALLFSNLDSNAKKGTIKIISNWYTESKELTDLESIVYFLNKYNDMGHSYSYTCNNLKFIGETILAKEKLTERDTFIKCSMKLANYPFWDSNYEDCIIIMLERENYLYKDRVLSSVVNDDLLRPSLATRSDYYDDWQVLFAALASYNKNDLPKTLIALMHIKDNLNEFDKQKIENWKKKYPFEYKNDYRICDFALLKYDETIEKIGVINWEDIEQRNKMIDLILKKYKD